MNSSARSSGSMASVPEVRLPGFPVTNDAPVLEAGLAVGTCTQGQVIAEQPVIQVMAALPAWPGPGRHFIVGKAGSMQKLRALLVDRPKPVVIRQRWWPGEELGIGLDGQLVPG